MKDLPNSVVYTMIFFGEMLMKIDKLSWQKKKKTHTIRELVCCVAKGADKAADKPKASGKGTQSESIWGYQQQLG